MKKVISTLVVLFMLAGVVSASSINGDFEGNPIVNLTSSGTEIEVQDVPAVLLNSRTMVPIYMLRQLGLNVSWDQQTYTVNVESQSTNNDVNYELIDNKKIINEALILGAEYFSISHDNYGGYVRFDYSSDNDPEIDVSILKVSQIAKLALKTNASIVTVGLFSNGVEKEKARILREDIQKYYDNEIDVNQFFLTWLITDSNTQSVPTSEVIESRIDGTFEGWSGDTVFKLENGQIWEQVSYAYHYHYAYRPNVLIYKDSYGNYKMQVDGVDGSITVRKIN